MWDNKNSLFTTQNGVTRLFDMLQLNDQHSTKVNKIFSVTNDNNKVYIVTNVGVYSIKYDNKNIWDEPIYLGLWNMPSGGYTGAAVTNNSLFVTLNGNQGVYKYYDNNGFRPSSYGIPGYKGDIVISEIIAERNCLRVKSKNTYYYSKDDGNTWLPWTQMPTYFSCG